MALEGEGGVTGYSAEHVERLLQCSVCLDRFKKPKQLPCQHTFCLSPCLEGLVNRLTRMLRCPECRAEHPVPRGGPSRFPNNLTLIGFLELPPIPGGSGCTPDNPRERGAAAAAVTAGNSAGDGSGQRSRVRARAGVDASGVVRDGGEGGGGGAVRGGRECPACHSEGRLSRCAHCERLLCPACKQAHMDMLRADVTRLASQVRRSLPRITDRVNQVGHLGAQLQSRCEGLKTEISDTIEKHTRDLKTRQRALNNDVDTFLVSELRGLRTHQENLEVELASMASFCDSAESSLSGAGPLSDGDLAEMKRQCVDNMETLRSYEDGSLRPPVPRNIQLSSESQFLSTCIHNLGDLIVTSGSSTIQAASAPPPLRALAPGSRDTLHAATDPAMSLWASAPDPSTLAQCRLSVAAARRRIAATTSLRNARSALDNVASEDLLEEDSPEPTPRVRRRCSRRQLADTTRAPSMPGGPSISHQIRTRLRQHQRGLRLQPQADELSDLSASSPEGDVLERGLLLRRRTRAFQDSDSETGVGQSLGSVGQSLGNVGQSLGLPSRHPAQSVLRFDVSLDTPEPVESSDPAHGAVPSYLNADTSPSMYVNTPRNKYERKSQALVCVGERGSGERQFTWPRGVAVSPLDDHIFVSDSSNHRVQVFDSTGVYVRSFGRYGQGEGEFDCLAGITVSGLGQVIITDRYNHRVQIFDQQGRFQRSFGSEGTSDGQLNYPWGVTCDSMGFIYVCDKENHRIQVFQANGDFVRKFGRLGNGHGQLDNPHYVAVSPDNKVYVSDSSNHRVQVFTIYGDFLFTFGLSGTLRGQMKYPRGIAIDNQGFVVVADSGNNRVQVFRADGRFFSMFGGWGSDSGQFKGIEGVAILANGNVVVSDRENHRIQIF